MSTYEDTLLTARFATLAPEPLPGDWNEVLDKAGAAGRRRRWLARSVWRTGGRRRKLVVALAVAVLATAVAAAAYGTVRVLFLDRGFVGLPPVGSSTSAPESGELLVSFNGRSATLPLYLRNGTRGPGHPMAHVFVYADGRVIWHREGWVPRGANDALSGFLEQRLTSEGAELLRSRVLSTGLFSEDLALVGDLEGWGAIQARNGGRLVTVRWTYPFPGNNIARTAATPEQVRGLLRLDALLGDPAASLPASAWQRREIRAYVPSRYATCWVHRPETGDPDRPTPTVPLSSILTRLPETVEDVLRRRGPVRRRTATPPTACSLVPTEEAHAISHDLRGAGLEEGVVGNGIDARLNGQLTYRFKAPEGRPGHVYVFFEPALPHGEWICAACG